ncbi:hypothetical protein C8R43DRAFT_251550 [Mycena crocata]|nr:hypothetical protein C8R43DRAFT_251550 [Mycena crocata]
MFDFDTLAHTPSLQSVILFLAAASFSVVPSRILHYTGLAVISSSILLYAVRYNAPSNRLSRLNEHLLTAAEILARARLECTWDYIELGAEETRFLRAKFAASKIQSLLFEARVAPWKIYLQKLRAVIHCLHQCEREVRAVQTATLLIIESENQRKLVRAIKESRKMTNAVAHSPGYFEGERDGANSCAAMKLSRVRTSTRPNFGRTLFHSGYNTISISARGTTSMARNLVDQAT